MWRLWAVLGAGVWLATIASSASMNYLAGYELGRSLIESRVFGVLGVSADAWKAVGPIFVAALWRERRRFPTLLASVVWLICFVFAISAALGLAARNRSVVVGGHEALRAQYENAIAELSEIERRRANLGEPRSVSEWEAEILSVLARPVPGGTVGTLSDECRSDHRRTRDDCANIAALRRNLATAVEATKLDDRVGSLRREADALRKRGALRESDPQAKLIAALSLGAIEAGNVGLLLVLLLVAMVELISAFAPVVVHEYALVSRPVAASRRHASSVAPGRDGSDGRLAAAPVPHLPAPSRPVGNVYEYLADRVEPDESGQIALEALHEDYGRWCAGREQEALRLIEFGQELDRIGERDLGGVIRRRGDVYRGLGLRRELAMARV